MTEKRNLLPAFAAALLEEKDLGMEGAQSQALPVDSEQTVSSNSRTNAPNQQIPSNQRDPWPDPFTEYDAYLAHIDELGRVNNWSPEEVVEEKAVYNDSYLRHHRQNGTTPALKAVQVSGRGGEF